MSQTRTPGLTPLLLSALLALSGCEPNLQSASTVGPEGGAIRSGDGLAELIVPAGALSEDVVITVTRTDEIALNYALAPTWDFQPDGLQFDVPATMRLTLDDDVDPSLILGLTLGWLEGNEFFPIDGVTTVTDGIAEGEVTHFTPYSIVGTGDNDGDGYSVPGGDCDDTNAAINPGATEACNGVDDDCDGQIPMTEADLNGNGILDCDEIPGTDADGDGFDDTVDCDDFDPNVYPGATELCNGVDDDCDGIVPADEFDGNGNGILDCNENPTGTDADGDGFLGGFLGNDCDDNDATIYPGALETCNGLDDDCDGFVDEDFDLDADGYQSPLCSGFGLPPYDCDDSNAAINPGATEVCDGLDNDCDGVIPTNEGDANGNGIVDCLESPGDADGDGWSPAAGDCDDSDPTVFPGAPEICDSVDNDCDGIVDDGYDADGDGSYDASDPGCVATYGAYADCDDFDPTVAPGSVELCDGLDNDCDGLVDEDFDQDADGYFSTSCVGGTDCDDTNGATAPGAPEICDGEDNDCDGVIPAPEADSDGDGFVVCTFVGGPGSPLVGGGDCDDNVDTINPGAVEICNGLDDDCDGFIPGLEGDANGNGIPDCDEITCSDGIDNDGDGWIDSADPECTPLLGGTEAGVSNGAACNDGVDNDGDGWIDSADPGCLDGSDTSE